MKNTYYTQLSDLEYDAYEVYATVATGQKIEDIGILRRVIADLAYWYYVDGLSVVEDPVYDVLYRALDEIEVIHGVGTGVYTGLIDE
jgi:hypothetical protein